MKFLIAVASLIVTSMPVQAETVYLLIKSRIHASGSGIALYSIPMSSNQQCEEAGALIISSQRFDLRHAKEDAFECIQGK